MRESADSSTRHQRYHVLSDATLSTGGSRSFVHMKVMGYLAFAVRENRWRWRALPAARSKEAPSKCGSRRQYRQRANRRWMATGNGTASSALAPSGVSVPQRPHHHTASHPMFYDAACEVHHEHFSPITDRRVKRPEIDLKLLDRSCLDDSVSARVGNGLKTR